MKLDLSGLVFAALLLLKCHSVRLMNTNVAQPAAVAAATGFQAPASAAKAAVKAANAAVDAAAWANAAAAAANTAANAAVNANMAAKATAASPRVVTANFASKAPPAASISAAVAPPPSVTSAAATPTSPRYIVQAFHLFAGLTFPMVVKALCVAGNVLVQVSPFPQVKRWEARGCTGESDAAPYVSIAFGGSQWCFYGIFAFIVTSRSGFLVLVQSNFLGAILGTYYVATFYRHCRNESSFNSLQKYLSAVTSLALLQVCAMSVLPVERALFLTGLVSSFCSFVGATSVLATVPAVIRSKDSSSIPGPYAAANLAASIVWSLCGYILEDPMVMMPNMFSTICSGTSLSLKVLYPSEASVSKEDNLASVAQEMGMDEEILPAHFCEKHARTELKSLHTYLSAPSELTPIKPASVSKNNSTTSPEHFQYFKGTGQKLLAAAVELRPSNWDADGTGGTF